MEQGSPLCARHELKNIPVWALKTVKLIYLQIVVWFTTFLDLVVINLISEALGNTETDVKHLLQYAQFKLVPQKNQAKYEK